MSKFNPGEFALLKGMKCSREMPSISKYEGTICEIIQFEGNVKLDFVFRSDGDWYLIKTEDDLLIYAREIVLHKLPNEYSPCEMTQFCKDFGYFPPKRKVLLSI